MAGLEDLLRDLVEEHDALAAVLLEAGAGALDAPTPADGWDVRDQLSHLAGFDEAATAALRDPAAFSVEVERILREGDDPVPHHTARGREMDDDDLLAWWHGARVELVAAAAPVDPKTRVPWYGPPMSAMSFVTARLMETWAHGQDVRDALGAPPSVSPRLRHVAHIGVGARAFSFVVHGEEPPEAPVDVALDGPGGELWRWGPGDAADRVEGPALHFCLLVTQRRHRADCRVRATGQVAQRWLDLAQAFAGGPGTGRRPGQFAPGAG